MTPPAVHAEHHAEFALYILLAIALLYWPPKSLRGLSGVRDFIEKHFGDSIGLYILHLGVLLVIVAGVWPDMDQVGQVGQSLILAAMGVLKLTKAPPNGTEKVETTTTHTLEPPPTAPPTDPLPTSAPPGENLPKAPAGWVER